MAWLATAVLLVTASLVPEAWWRFLIPQRDLHAPAMLTAGPDFELLDLEVVAPPPEIVLTPDVPDEPPAPEPHVDPDWWTRSWNARIDADLGRATAVLPDTLLPGPLLDIWGAQASVEHILAQPDSVVEARIWRLVQSEELTRDDATGIFSAIAKARAYQDLKSREAAMFDEFANETVPVTK